MGFWSNIFSRDSSTPLRQAVSEVREAGGIDATDTTGALRGIFGMGNNVAGVTVNETTALSFAAVWACVRVIAESVAQLPLFVYEDTATGARKAPEHPAYRVLQVEPNPRQTSFSFRELMVATCCLWGNAYAIIVRNGLYEPTELNWVHPRHVTVLERNGLLYYQITQSNGQARVYQAYEVLHIAGLGFNGVTGKSVLQVARENIGLGLAAQQYGINFYENGANVPGTLETPTKLTADRIENLRTQWQNKYAGVSNAHKPLILEEGMTYKAIGMPPADAQFVETRALQTSEVARMFRVQPHKIGDLSRSTNNNIEHQGLEFVTDTLNPWLVRFEQEYRRKLFTEAQKATYYCKHNVNSLLRGDHAARAQFYKDLWNIGVFSQNQILALEEMNGIGDAGDRRYVPLNMVPADKIDEFLASKTNVKTENPAV